MATVRIREPRSLPILLSYGFRPLFLGGAAFGIVGILVWLPVFEGRLALPLGMPARDWHGHEMTFGYGAAVIAGFLFTAIPNWTGRAPVAGATLLLLVVTWLAGRIAMAASGLLGLAPTAAVDLAFLVLVAAVAGREIVAGNSRRNFKLLGVLAILIAANAVFHLEVIRDGTASYGHRMGLAAVVALIVLIGGRIVPNFTRNALMRAEPGSLPAPFGRFDMASPAGVAVALASWVAAPDDMVTAVLCGAAGLLLTVRLGRWAGHRAWRDPLVLVLHAGYAFVPLGFLMVALSIAQPALVLPGAGVHAWGAGAIAVMTLAVMTRATLGHTGRPLTASRGTVVVYLLAVLAALARIGAAIPSTMDILLLHIAVYAWVGAFAGFVAIYGPMLITPKVSVAPPGR